MPVATITGWNVRAPGFRRGGRTLLSGGLARCLRQDQGRARDPGDPRPSLSERYRDAADYAERVRNAAAALARDGFLLEEDVKRYADRAAATNW